MTLRGLAPYVVIGVAFGIVMVKSEAIAGTWSYGISARTSLISEATANSFSPSSRKEMILAAPCGSATAPGFDLHDDDDFLEIATEVRSH